MDSHSSCALADSFVIKRCQLKNIQNESELRIRLLKSNRVESPHQQL